jgi:hypothetical protein
MTRITTTMTETMTNVIVNKVMNQLPVLAATTDDYQVMHTSNHL